MPTSSACRGWVEPWPTVTDTRTGSVSITSRTSWAVIADAAADRGEPPEFKALVQVVEITEGRERAFNEPVDRVDGLRVDDAAATPYLAIGTADEIANRMVHARNRWVSPTSLSAPRTWRRSSPGFANWTDIRRCITGRSQLAQACRDNSSAWTLPGRRETGDGVDHGRVAPIVSDSPMPRTVGCGEGRGHHGHPLEAGQVDGRDLAVTREVAVRRLPS